MGKGGGVYRVVRPHRRPIYPAQPCLEPGPADPNMCDLSKYDRSRTTSSFQNKWLHAAAHRSCAALDSVVAMFYLPVVAPHHELGLPWHQRIAATLWFATLSALWVHAAVRRVPPGLQRVVLAAPALAFFVLAPVLFDPIGEVLSRTSALFILSWLGTFKVGRQARPQSSGRRAPACGTRGAPGLRSRQARGPQARVGHAVPCPVALPPLHVASTATSFGGAVEHVPCIVAQRCAMQRCHAARCTAAMHECRFAPASASCCQCSARP